MAALSVVLLIFQSAIELKYTTLQRLLLQLLLFVYNTIPSQKRAHGRWVHLTLGLDWGMGRYSRHQYRS